MEAYKTEHPHTASSSTHLETRADQNLLNLNASKVQVKSNTVSYIQMI